LGLTYGATRGQALSAIWQDAKGKIEAAKTAISRSGEKQEKAKKDSSSQSEAQINGESLESIFDRLVAPKFGNGDARPGGLFTGQAKFLCGFAAFADRATGMMRFERFVANPRTRFVYIEGSNDWTPAT
jgi:hypothetical protein